ncbi:MAG: GFA family protein [Amphiplicatus sp.]
MTERTAACSCGKLRIAVSGDPVRVSICHCLECQKRTGSVFGAQARFRRDQVISMEGAFTTYTRVGDEGVGADFHFCPACGSIVHYAIRDQPDLIAIPVGAFADPSFPAPQVSVYEARRHHWVLLPDDGSLHHID